MDDDEDDHHIKILSFHYNDIVYRRRKSPSPFTICILLFIFNSITRLRSRTSLHRWACLYNILLCNVPEKYLPESEHRFSSRSSRVYTVTSCTPRSRSQISWPYVRTSLQCIFCTFKVRFVLNAMYLLSNTYAFLGIRTSCLAYPRRLRNTKI